MWIRPKLQAASTFKIDHPKHSKTGGIVSVIVLKMGRRFLHPFANFHNINFSFNMMTTSSTGAVFQGGCANKTCF